MLATPTAATTYVSAVAPAPLPPPRDSCDLIWRLMEAGATLTRLNCQATAKSLLDDTTALVEVWYDEAATGGAAEAVRQGFIAHLRLLLAWAEKSIRTVEVERMEQLTAARAHCGETAAAIDTECRF